MAKAKDKREALAEWAGHFPDLVPWKNQFLIRRNGGLLSGICLDELRDPNAYKPTFFFHNLLVPSPVVTLSYAAPLLLRGVYKPVKYGDPGESIATFKKQLPIDQEPSLASFIAHVSAACAGKFGAQAIYVPHFFRDVITLGSTRESYYLGVIEKCAKAIETLPGINLNLIGSVAEWQADVRHHASCDTDVSIAEQLSKLKLPELSDAGLRVEIVDEFWKLITDRNSY